MCDIVKIFVSYQHLCCCFLYCTHCLCCLQISFDLAEYTADVDGVGTLRLLDAIKTCGLINSVKFYQASTSELYGKVQEIPQKETTPFYPRSPYGKNAYTPPARALYGCRHVCFCFNSVHVSWLKSFGCEIHIKID